MFHQQIVCYRYLEEVRSFCLYKVFIQYLTAMLFLALVTLQLLVSCTAFYSPGDNVVELNPTNFQHKVIQSDGIWLVEFYAPW